MNPYLREGYPMKPSGSVLIVVLGLLAILALIGITFITMSNLDRRTATNFALQSQFMLAADGAVDYVCHHLVQDAWAYDPQSHSYKDQLLNDYNPNRDNGLLRNEPFDYPHDDYDPWLSTSPDTQSGGSQSLPLPPHFSYAHLTPEAYNFSGTRGPFGLRDWGESTETDCRPNNLGFPTFEDNRVKVKVYTQSGQPGHGVWNPELSFPCETGLVRVSVTVIDHASMVNLNAHGNTAQSRHGYYVSDFDPSALPGLSTGGLATALAGGGTTTDPLYGSDGIPGNPVQMAAVIENPEDYHDRPFTLDEEVELRRLTGTFFRSRLETCFTDIESDPEDTQVEIKARRRLSLTTVGWTSQVRPNRTNGSQASPRFNNEGEGYRWRKVDLNRDKPADIKDAVQHANIFQDSNNVARQFAANICGFRNGEEGNAVKEYDGTLGASRQPLFSKVKATVQNTTNNQNEPISRWTVEVQVISPWDGDHPGDTGGLGTDGISLNAQGANFDDSLPDPMPGPGEANQFSTSCTVEVPQGEHFTEELEEITLECKGKVIDKIEDNEMGGIEDGKGIHRPIHYEDEERYSGDSHPVRVVYIGDWTGGFGNSMTEWSNPQNAEGTSNIPIRFPRSVGEDALNSASGPAHGLSDPTRLARRTDDADDLQLTILAAAPPPPPPPPPPGGGDGPEGGLPPHWRSGISENYGYRAFARLGDLNQVLCPEKGQDFWPWVPRVAKAGPGDEDEIKFCWRDDSTLQHYGDTNRMNAANIFCVGGPWNDVLDNDGDGAADADSDSPDRGILQSSAGAVGGPTRLAGRANDAAVADDLQLTILAFQPQPPPTGGGGRFGGPEIRVAGQINVNTATRDTLQALGTAFGIGNLDGAVLALRQNGPILSPAQIARQNLSTSGGNPKGDPTEGVEANEMAYTLLSNILTVRSDTFSVYGTVQYGHVASNTFPYKFNVVRSRRFWALVDRSPSLAFCPHDNEKPNKEFIHPRVLNFQWLD